MTAIERAGRTGNGRTIVTVKSARRKILRIAALPRTAILDGCRIPQGIMQRKN
ncbi:MAG: hypothetical protein NT080_08720 [Spirochaetes bacterium]|nr:hypothetical protein [Spirochaetota bacterium]